MKLSGMRCQCTSCGEYFNRVSTFDKHRTGEYSSRKCATREEMEAKGWSKNASGFWITSSGNWRQQA